MAALHNNAFFGTSGDTVAANGGNSAGANGDYWDTVNIAPSGAFIQYSNTQKILGGVSIAIGTSASSNSSFLIWRNSGGVSNSLTFPGTSMWACAYLRFTNLPTIGRFFQFTNSSIQLQGGLGVNASRQIQVKNSDNGVMATSTAAIPNNQWVRVELYVLSHASTGQVICRYYADPYSITPTETISSGNTNTRGGNIAAVVLGYPTSTTTTQTIYVQGVSCTNDTWVGTRFLTQTNFI